MLKIKKKQRHQNDSNDLFLVLFANNEYMQLASLAF